MADTPDSLPVSDARARIAEVVGAAQHAGTRTVLTKHGRPVAAVVPIADLDRLRELDDAGRARETLDLAGTPAEAWEWLVVPRLRARWWPGSTLVDEVGAEVTEPGGVTSEVREVVEHRRLAWRGAAGPVRLELAVHAGGTRVTVVAGPDQCRAWRTRLDTWAGVLTT